MHFHWWWSAWPHIMPAREQSCEAVEEKRRTENEELHGRPANSQSAVHFSSTYLALTEWKRDCVNWVQFWRDDRTQFTIYAWPIDLDIISFVICNAVKTIKAIKFFCEVFIPRSARQGSVSSLVHQQLGWRDVNSIIILSVLPRRVKKVQLQRRQLVFVRWDFRSCENKVQAN